MKVLRLLVMLAFLLVGLIIGAVNSQDITLDFLFSSVHTSSGVAIIVALLVGVLIGAGIVLVSVVIPSIPDCARPTRLLRSVAPTPGLSRLPPSSRAPSMDCKYVWTF